MSNQDKKPEPTTSSLEEERNAQAKKLKQDDRTKHSTTPLKTTLGDLIKHRQKKPDHV